MTEDRFFALVDEALARLHAEGELDVEAFIAQQPEAETDFSEFLRDVIAWRAENERSRERARARLLATIPAIVDRIRNRTLGELFTGIDGRQAEAHGIRALAWRRLREDRTSLIDLVTVEERIAKARELRVDVPIFLGLFDQVTDPEPSQLRLYAAKHEDDPTKEDE